MCLLVGGGADVDDGIRGLHHGCAVSDDDHGASLAAHVVDSAYDGLLTEGIEVSGRFIKNDELGARCESARQGQALALPNGQADTAGPDNGIPPVGGGGQDAVKAGSCCCSIKVLEGQAAHVVQDRPRHEGGGLGNPSDLITPGGGIDV